MPVLPDRARHGLLIACLLVFAIEHDQGVSTGADKGSDAYDSYWPLAVTVARGTISHLL